MTTPSESIIVREAPHLASLIASQPSDGLSDDRARGVLLGLAVGNLLGLPIEGARRASIRRRYPDGIVDIDPLERQRLLDDDLAQAVDLAESLVVEGDAADELAARLIRWRRENGRGIGIMTRGVIELLEQGLGVPGAAERYWRDDGAGETQPNGGLMRCAPVAVRYADQPTELIAETARTCAVTHVAPGAQWSCIVVNAAIAMLLRGATPSRHDLIDAASEDGAPSELLEWANAIPSAIDDLIAAESMIGHTYLCMQAALWCLDCDDDLEAALVRIVSAGGDTDTNGAVAGAMLGARYGASAIPERWLDCIPQRARLESAVKAMLERPD